MGVTPVSPTPPLTSHVPARRAAIDAGADPRLCRAFPFGYHRTYVFCKLLLDPVYRAAEAELHGSRLPLLDIGCGIGLLAHFLRARGYAGAIHGIDCDQAKVAVARQASARDHASRFDVQDARKGIPAHDGNVTILDILQFFDSDEQARLLSAAADRVAPGGRLIIRSGLRGEGWRFWLTRWGDWFAKVTVWMQHHPVHYPDREMLLDVLESAGLRGELRPLTGALPFNNYLLSFRRPG